MRESMTFSSPPPYTNNWHTFLKHWTRIKNLINLYCLLTLRKSHSSFSPSFYRSRDLGEFRILGWFPSFCLWLIGLSCYYNCSNWKLVFLSLGGSLFFPLSFLPFFFFPHPFLLPLFSCVHSLKATAARLRLACKTRKEEEESHFFQVDEENPSMSSFQSISTSVFVLEPLKSFFKYPVFGRDFSSFFPRCFCQIGYFCSWRMGSRRTRKKMCKKESSLFFSSLQSEGKKD